MDKKQSEKLTTLWMFKNADGVLEYYRRCKEQKIKTQVGREKLLIQLAKEGKLQSIQQTKRSTDQVITDYRKQGMNILDMRSKFQPGIFTQIWRWLCKPWM